MSMLGLKTLPHDHPLHGVYRVSAGLIGAALVGFGVACLLVSEDRLLRVGTSDGFGGLLVVAGVLLVGAAIVGGNVAAQVNGNLGAVLLVIGLIGLLSQGNDANVLDITVSDVIVLFVVGMLLLTAGFYGQVAAAAPYGDSRGPEHGEDAPETGRPATGDPLEGREGPGSPRRERR